MEGIIGAIISNKEYEIFPHLGMFLCNYQKLPSVIFDLWMSCPQMSTKGRLRLAGNSNKFIRTSPFSTSGCLTRKGPPEVAFA